MREKKTNNQDMLRCSTKTKNIIMRDVQHILFPTLTHPLPQGVILEEMTKIILKLENSHILKSEHFQKINIHCKREHIRYGGDVNITIDELVEMMIDHYLISDPR